MTDPILKSKISTKTAPKLVTLVALCLTAASQILTRRLCSVIFSPFAQILFVGIVPLLRVAIAHLLWFDTANYF